jgi:alpha-glucosidase
VTVAEDQTPLYVRDGSIIPMRPGIATDHRTALHDVELHLFLAGDGQTAAIDYVADDGLTYAYQRGARSRLRVEAAAKGDTVEIMADLAENGAGPLQVRFAVHGPFGRIQINGDEVPAAPLVTRLAGADVAPLATERREV